jgi:hypothetical protein
MASIIVVEETIIDIPLLVFWFSFDGTPGQVQQGCVVKLV